MLWAKANRFLSSSSFRFALLALVLIWFALTLVLLGMFQFNRSNMVRVLDWQMNTDEETVVSVLENSPSTNIESLLSDVTIQPNTQIFLDGSLIRDRVTSDFQLDQDRGVKALDDGPSKDYEISRDIVFEEYRITLVHAVGWFDDLYEEMIEIIARALVATLLLAILISVFLAQRSVSRLQKINEACQKIIDGNLSHRMPMSTKKVPDDYDQLSQTLNTMLDRIQQLMQQVAQVSDNIAHDLRSPLTRLRVRLEGLNEKQNSEDLNDAVNEADRLLAMFNALLRISKIEANSLEAKEPVDVRKVLVDACDMYRPLAETKGIHIDVHIGEGKVRGETNLLFQAFSNILDNGVKFAPKDSRIRISSYASDNQYTIAFSDEGPGIPESEFDNVFERFVRLDESRSLPGFGLGLSQVKAIVNLHSGNITLSNEVGLTVAVSFPLAVV